MWLLKDILLTKLNGLRTNNDWMKMRSKSSLSRLILAFENGKIFEFDFSDCGEYKLMSIAKRYLKPYTKASGNCHLYEFIDEYLIHNNIIVLPNTNKKEY